MAYVAGKEGHFNGKGPLFNWADFWFNMTWTNLLPRQGQLDGLS
jgi:hypothetical protein